MCFAGLIAGAIYHNSGRFTLSGSQLLGNVAKESTALHSSATCGISNTLVAARLSSSVWRRIVRMGEGSQMDALRVTCGKGQSAERKPSGFACSPCTIEHYLFEFGIWDGPIHRREDCDSITSPRGGNSQQETSPRGTSWPLRYVSMANLLAGRREGEGR